MCEPYELPLNSQMALRLECALSPHHRGKCSTALDKEAEVIIMWPRKEK